MTGAGRRSSSSLLRRRARASPSPPLGRYMAAVYGSRADGTAPGDRVFAPDRAAHLPPAARRRATRAALERLRHRRCWRSASSRSSSSTCCSGCRAACRSTRRTCRGVAPLGAFNTAVSFMTNTNWQWYGGELDDEPPHPDGRPGGAELRVGRGRHGGRRGDHPRHRPPRRGARSATSGSTSPARRCASCCRSRSSSPSLLSLGGVVQNFTGHTDGDAGRRRRRRRGPTQSIPGGPVASQIAIKQLGTNGGGFFNANSAHPFENPTPVTNFIEMLGDPASSRSPSSSRTACMVGSKKQARVLLAVMVGIWLAVRGARDRRRADRQPEPRPRSASTRAIVDRLVGGQPRGQGGPLRRRRRAGCGRRRRPARRTARSTACTTASRRSAG